MKGNQNKLNKNTIDIPHQTEVKQMTDLLDDRRGKHQLRETKRRSPGYPLYN